MSVSETTESGDALRKLNEQEALSLGIATGCVEQCVSQPLLYWKNAYQQGLSFTMNPKVVYRGTAASVLNFSALTGLQFISAGFFQKIITGGADKEMSFGQEVAAGFLGGAVSGPICAVLELTMIQQQRFGGTIYGTQMRILRDAGPSALMRGVVPATGREALYTAGYLGSVPATQKYLKDYGFNPWISNFLSATGAGLLCALISQPLDTAKTCMQGDIEMKKYGSLTGTLRTLREEYGSVRAMYRGYWWRAVYIIFDFIALDFLAKNLAPVMYPDKCK